MYSISFIKSSMKKNLPNCNQNALGNQGNAKEGPAMKKTNYKTVTSYKCNGCPVIRCVYEDENGKKYIKVEGQFKCIENTPCAESLIKNF